MSKMLTLITLCASLTACAEYEGRETNCWSGANLNLSLNSAGVGLGCQFSNPLPVVSAE